MLKFPKSFTTIGLGKVGKIFTTLLKEEVNLELDYIIDNNSEIDNFLNTKIIKDIPKKIDSDLIVISTPDDRIEEIINLLNSEHITPKNVMFLHFSGALYIKSNKNIISIHPMMSFTNHEKDLLSLSKHYFTLQSDKEDIINLFLPIIKKITNNFIIINGEDKKNYHLASVMINNFSTMLMKSSIEVIKKTNLPETDALNILLPLLEDVFINLKNNQSISKSLTGPVVRGDNKTINLHLELLRKLDLKDENKIYNVFLDYIIKNLLLLK